MRLNQKVSYGLVCLFELAKWPTEYVDAERIARARAIPPAYAQKILQALGHAGLVHSQKGSGYRIARSLSDITALDVINALSQETGEGAQGPGRLLERRLDDTLARVSVASLAAAA